MKKTALIMILMAGSSLHTSFLIKKVLLLIVMVSLSNLNYLKLEVEEASE